MVEVSGGVQNEPVERPREDEIVIDAQLIKAFCKITLENKPAGLVDYY